MPLLHVPKSRYQFCDGRLSAAGGTDKRRHRSRPELKADVVQNLLVAITKGNIFNGNVVTVYRYPLFSVSLLLGVQKLVNRGDGRSDLSQRIYEIHKRQ